MCGVGEAAKNHYEIIQTATNNMLPGEYCSNRTETINGKSEVIESCFCMPEIDQSNMNETMTTFTNHDGDYVDDMIHPKMFQEACNGPRKGIETHQDGLRCWTCGDRPDSKSCKGFVPHNEDDYWSHDCLKEDNYCVVQVIIGADGNKSK